MRTSYLTDRVKDCRYATFSNACCLCSSPSAQHNFILTKVMLKNAASDSSTSGGTAASAKERDTLQSVVASCLRALLALLSCQLPPEIEDDMRRQLLHLLNNSGSIFTTDARLNLVIVLVKLATREQTFGAIIEEVRYQCSGDIF